VEIVFTIAEDGEHYHVPLLLNPFGYTTYRGS
jgi:5-hydroxyisourate hydrolase